MNQPDVTIAGRDYRRLFAAMNAVLGALLAEGDEGEALRASFEAAAAGFGAENALLLLVDSREPLRLLSIHARGRLTAGQIRACEQGKSVRGVSSSVIRRALDSAAAVWVPDPRLSSGAKATASLEGGNFSVLCTPVSDPYRGGTLAVLYFQNSGLTNAFTEEDLVWLQGYAEALSKIFGFHFAQRRQTGQTPNAREDEPDDAPELIGDSAHTQALRRLLHEVFIPAIAAPHPDPILILGDPGTGKDLVARYLHAWSARRKRPFVVANCAEISDELAAARFFGHKRGAFTGAVTDEPGFFRAAQGGVFFLDEIGDLAPRAQAVLLRVLENHRVGPVGQTQEIEVDVALVLATNHDLKEATEEGRIRRDFYDRFRTQVIRLLPLRERPWDIPILLEHFRRHHERRSGKRTLGFSQEALRVLASYEWPGNVREVARSCSLLVTHAKPGAHIDRALVGQCLPEILEGPPNPKAGPVLWDGVSMREAVRAFQRELIASRLERHDWNTASVRRSLRLTKTTFHRYMKALGIPFKPRAPGDLPTASPRSTRRPPSGMGGSEGDRG